jgi:hypothetical protein
VRACTNCGNTHCSMHGGVCGDWVVDSRTASPVA